MTEQWQFKLQLKPGPALDDCWLLLEVTDSEETRKIPIPAQAILSIEQGFTRARHMIAGHLKGVQQILNQAQVELASLPEIEEPKK